MKRFTLIAVSMVAALSLSACTTYGAYGGYDRGYYDVYYDNAYGPVSDGYWNNDGWFYYRDARTRQYHRDDGRHFRRDAANGYHVSRMYHRDDARSNDNRRGSDRRTR